MRNIVLYGDAAERLKDIPSESVQMVVCSPPYWGLRDYGHEGQIGHEETPEDYYLAISKIFEQVKRVLKPDGTVWLNIGDSYARDAKKGQHKPGDPGKQDYIYSRGGGKASTEVDLQKTGLKPKDLVGIPWRTALSLQRFGWYLRADIIWHKPNSMPDPVKDRPTLAHEYVFLLTKNETYFYDHEALQELGKNGQYRNRRTVWDINTVPYAGAHFAVMPPELASLCIQAGSRKGDIVLDPFAGSGTTLAVAADLQRDYIGIELNEDHKPLIEERLEKAEDGRHAQDMFDGMNDLGTLSE